MRCQKCQDCEYHDTCDAKRMEILECLSGDAVRSLLNEHGKYVLKFAESHGISIFEAQDHPMVKAHANYIFGIAQGNVRTVDDYYGA